MALPSSPGKASNSGPQNLSDTGLRNSSGSGLQNPNFDDSACRTITTYTFSTAVYYRDLPQPTPLVHTLTIPDPRAQSLPTPVPVPGPSSRRLKKRDTVQEEDTESIMMSQQSQEPPPPPPDRSRSYQWQDVVAVQHVTSVGHCPSPTPLSHSASLPLPTSQPSPEPGPADGHEVNVHMAILAGAVTVGAIVMLLAVVAGGIIGHKRYRRRAEDDNKEVDETATYQSYATNVSSQTSMTERKLNCQTGWQMNNVSMPGPLSPFSPLESVSPSSIDKLETLARPRETPDPFRDHSGIWSCHLQLSSSSSTRPESLSDVCSTEAPSYLPGDDAKFMVPQNRCQGSTTALTEISCAATIDSSSSSIRTNALNSSGVNESLSNTNPTTITPNLDSLISHKAFLLSMMVNRHISPSSQDESRAPDTLTPPQPVAIARSRPQSSLSFNESTRSDSTHESTYWNNRSRP